MTSQVKRKRLDLLTAVHKGLIPPETPPSMRKSRKRRLPGLMGMDPEEDVNFLMFLKILLNFSLQLLCFYFETSIRNLIHNFMFHYETKAVNVCINM